MLRQRQKIRLIEDKHTKFSVVRAIVIATLFLMAFLTLAGVVVFSCVHGTTIS